MRKKMRKGQSVLEYALLFSAVAAVFVTAQVYLRRAVNANIHTFQEQLDEKPN
jgi:Flp pilus assembly pilin Flp